MPARSRRTATAPVIVPPPSMNLISRILPVSNIVTDCTALNKAAVFEHAGALFEASHSLSRKVVIDALTQREKLGSTGLGQGIAIPHGRIKGLKDALGAFIHLAHPIAFDAPDDRPVELLFIMLVPEQANERHLQLLSELAQMFSDRNFREELAATADKAAIMSLFDRWDPHAPNEHRPAV
jgi:nitrogen PTS system EIIA component